MTFRGNPRRQLSGNKKANCPRPVAEHGIDNTVTSDHSTWMRAAISLAAEAESRDEVPVAALVVRDGDIIGRGFNQNIGLVDPTAHAEILALRQAAITAGNHRLSDCTLYTTLEPCPMCAGAIVHARIHTVVYGAADPRAGAAGSVLDLLQHPSLNHRCEVIAGIMSAECGSMLQTFFRRKRI